MTDLVDLNEVFGITPYIRDSLADRQSCRPEIDHTQARRPGIQATIVVVEPRGLIRDCLTYCLQASGSHLVLACTSPEEGVTLVERLPGPLIFLLQASDQLTAEIEKAIRLLSRLAPTVVMAELEEPIEVLEALKQGAKGYIPTSISVDVALEALRLVIAGGTFVPANSFLSSRPS